MKDVSDFKTLTQETRVILPGEKALMIYGFNTKIIYI